MVLVNEGGYYADKMDAVVDDAAKFHREIGCRGG